MKDQIKVWGTRLLSIAVIAFVAQHWGIPLYKQYFTPKKESVFIPTAKVRQGMFTVSFHEMGNMQAAKSVAVASEVNGKIISLVTEGKVVKNGDKLVELDTSDVQKEVRNQELNFKNTVNDLDRAKAAFELLKKSNQTDLAQATKDLDYNKSELEVAKSELTIAQQDLEKQKRLAGKKLVPETQVQQAEANVRGKEGIIRSKQLAIDKAQLQLQLKQEEVRNKEAQEAGNVANVGFRSSMAKMMFDEVQKRLKGSIIKATADGMVVLEQTYDGSGGRRPIKEGDMVNPRQTIIQLPDLGKMLVRVQVGEADAPKVRIDMPVRIKLEAIPDKVYHGKVKDVSPLASMGMPWEPGATAGRKSFQVTIDVAEADPRTMKPGMTADVEFICDTIARTIYVPMESVVEREGKTWVFVKQAKDDYRRTRVTVGTRNDNFVEIEKGLKPGQVVALRDPTKPVDEQEASGLSSEGKGSKDKKDKKDAVPIPESGKE